MRILGTAVRVEPTVLLPVAVVWGAVSLVGLRRHPERRLWQGLLVGLASTIALLPSDFGHPFAHVLSARYAGAPMDEILISAGMPRTLYWNNDVSPDTHRLRALGGLVYNALGCLLSLAIYRLAPRASIVRELAGWSGLGHGLILTMSLTPVPVVDGGTLLKWTLVARGRSEAQADAMVRRVDWGLAILGVIAGLCLLVGRLSMLRRSQADR